MFLSDSLYHKVLLPANHYRNFGRQPTAQLQMFRVEDCRAIRWIVQEFGECRSVQAQSLHRPDRPDGAWHDVGPLPS